MKPCKECPFYTKTPLDGSPEWLKDVIFLNEKDKFFNHTCHKTDPKADGFRGAKKVRECIGHLTMQMNYLDKTPGYGGVYKSIRDLAETYLKSWLGEKTFNNLKMEYQNEGPKL